MNNKNWKRLCKGEIQAQQIQIDFKEVEIERKQVKKRSPNEGASESKEKINYETYSII